MTPAADKLQALYGVLASLCTNGSPVAAELEDLLPRDLWREIIANDPNEPPAPPDEYELTLPDEWPTPIGKAAFVGLAGDYVRAVEEYSEADPAALLTHFLAYAGILVGQSTHGLVGYEIHPARHNLLVIGPTGMRGRKGTAESPASELLRRVDPTMEDRLRSGLVSGEGLVWHIRDADRDDDGSDGTADKRLVTVETEFASLLQVIKRQGNTTSTMLRRAWDGKTIETLSKSRGARCKRPHIAVVGHITPEELKTLADDVDINNGLLNRFIWCAARRAKLLPDGPVIPDGVFNPLVTKLREVHDWCQTARVLARDANADALWRKWYEQWMDTPREGLVAAALGRLDAITHRLAVGYAQLAQSETITVRHLEAARAVAEYHERTVAWLLGDTTGNRYADELLPYLAQIGSMSRNDVNDFFGGHCSKTVIDVVRDLLMRKSRLRVTVARTGQPGRPPETWHHQEARP